MDDELKKRLRAAVEWSRKSTDEFKAEIDAILREAEEVAKKKKLADDAAELEALRKKLR